VIAWSDEGSSQSTKMNNQANSIVALTQQRCGSPLSQNGRGILIGMLNFPSPCGRRWPLGRMRGFLQVSNFHYFFYSAPIPHPPLPWSPLSQIGRGILIGMLNFPSPCGRRWPSGRMRGFLQVSNFYSSSIPHPPLVWSPLSQIGRGFLVRCRSVCWCVSFCWSTTACNFERIFLLHVGEGGR